jgi:hypothetical protein
MERKHRRWGRPLWCPNDELFDRRGRPTKKLIFQLGRLLARRGVVTDRQAT